MLRSSAFFLVSLATASLSPYAATASQSSFLSPEESRLVVREIDGICGDTWCSGDLNYLFDRLECSAESCFFDVRAEIRDFSEETETVKRESRPFRCQLKGFQSRADLIDESGWRLTYSSKLYEAVGQCLYEQLPLAHPVIYLPDPKSCQESIEQKPYYQSAAHSAYAEIFYEEKKSILAAAQTLNDMVSAYAKTDNRCQLIYAMAFQDQAECRAINGKQVCSLPAGDDQFLVIKDYVDSAAVLYFKGKSNAKPSFGKIGKNSLDLKLADSSLCYTELLNFNGKQTPAQPFASSDHRSYYVSTKALRASDDARLKAATLVNNVVRKLSRQSPQECVYQEQKVSLAADACQQVAGRDVCLVAGSNQGGYFLVTKDNADGALVSFIRFD